MKYTSKFVAALLVMDSARAIQLNSRFPADLSQEDNSMDTFMSNQMKEVEGGSQIQKAVVEEPKKEIKQAAPQDKQS